LFRFFRFFCILKNKTKRFLGEMSRHGGHTDTATFTALLNELKSPLTGAAASLSKTATGDFSRGGRGLGGDDLRKLKFSELAERFEHLNQVLPDMLRCVHEVKGLQQSVAEQVDTLERRQQSEEAYLSSLQELQEAILSQGAVLHQGVRESMAQLRQVLDEREYYLLSKVKEVEGEKLRVLERQRQQCTSTVENMRAASRQARQALSAEDMTVWLDHGREVDRMLTEQNAAKVDYGPSPDLRFNCTLTADLQRRILEVIDFDEKKGSGSPTRLVADRSAIGGGGSSSGGLSLRSSPPGAGGYGGAGFALTPSSGGHGVGGGSGSAVNQGRGLSGLQGMTLPDGTDYATFRRTLLAGVGAGDGLYRDPPVATGRALGYDAGGSRPRAGL
jgi:hypothetical protein